MSDTITAIPAASTIDATALLAILHAGRPNMAEHVKAVLDHRYDADRDLGYALVRFEEAGGWRVAVLSFRLQKDRVDAPWFGNVDYQGRETLAWYWNEHLRASNPAQPSKPARLTLLLQVSATLERQAVADHRAARGC